MSRFDDFDRFDEQFAETQGERNERLATRRRERARLERLASAPSPEMAPGLLARLEAWREHDFHADRQLADEILIADGWKCEPCAEFESGIRWYWGTSPQVSVSEVNRPHPINDLKAAVALVPFKMDWCLARITGGPLSGKPGPRFVAEITDYDGRISDVSGESCEPTVAMCIAYLKARALMTAKLR